MKGSGDGSVRSDHLGRLLFTGTGSGGTYGPGGVDLRLSGDDPGEHAVVRLHEAHHVGLNDSTAWGTMLQVFARLGGDYEASFQLMLDASRLTHESFATYASVSTVLARHPHAEAVLLAYPDYVPLHRSTGRSVAGVGGPHRRYLMASAMARLAMQTPVLEVLAGGLRPLSPADFRNLDLPDGRWRWLLRLGTDTIGRIGAAADDAVRTGYGANPLDADGRADPIEVADDRFDGAWNAWERAAYDHLGSLLEGAGGQPLSYNGHQGSDELVVAAARAMQPDLDLRTAGDADAPDDRSLAAATIERVRNHHTTSLWRAALIEVDLDEIIEHCAQREIDGLASLMVDVRLSTRLLDLYRWDSDDLTALSDTKRVVVAIRLIGDDEGESVILHHLLDSPAALDSLAQAWGDRGPLLGVISVSALVDHGWSELWLEALSSQAEPIMLIDCEIDRFASNWSRPDVRLEAVRITIADASRGSVHAAAIFPSNCGAIWLFLGDEVSTNLLLFQLGATPGVTLQDRDELTHEEIIRVRATAAHLLGTESFTDLDGLKGYL